MHSVHVELVGAEEHNTIHVNSFTFGVQLFLYEALGLCAEGKGDTLVDSAKWITNNQGSSNCRVTLP